MVQLLLIHNRKIAEKQKWIWTLFYCTTGGTSTKFDDQVLKISYVMVNVCSYYPRTSYVVVKLWDATSDFLESCSVIEKCYAFSWWSVKWLMENIPITRPAWWGDSSNVASRGAGRANVGAQFQNRRIEDMAILRGRGRLVINIIITFFVGNEVLNIFHWTIKEKKRHFPK